jgi:hypothetical protein
MLPQDMLCDEPTTTTPRLHDSNSGWVPSLRKVTLVLPAAGLDRPGGVRLQHQLQEAEQHRRHPGVADEARKGVGFEAESKSNEGAEAGQEQHPTSPPQAAAFSGKASLHRIGSLQRRRRAAGTARIRRASQRAGGVRVGPRTPLAWKPLGVPRRCRCCAVATVSDPWA